MEIADMKWAVGTGDPALEVSTRLRIVVVIDFLKQQVEAAQRYESLVLPLLGDHGGRLDQRYRTLDSCTEIHHLSFTSREGYEAFLADPRRAAYQQSTGVELFGRVLEVDQLGIDDLSHADHSGTRSP